MTARIMTLNPRTWTWLALLLIVLIFIGLGSFLVPDKPTPYPEYITESPSPTGVKAFYTMLNESMEQVKIWKQSSNTLPHLASSQLMIMVQPYHAFNSDEMSRWIKWMEAGNRLWLIDQNPGAFFDLKTTWAGENIGEEPQTIQGLQEMKGTYQALVHTDVRLMESAEDQVLLKDSAGVIALSRPFGKGELMVLLTPHWMTNGEILKEDHVPLLLPFIERAESEILWFNDYVHGYHHGPTILELYPEWFILMLTQAVIILLLWLWYKGKRFGPVEIPREWVVRMGDERIRALAAWYQRGEFYQEALTIQVNYLRQLIFERWRIPAHIELKEFNKAVQRWLPPDRHKEWRQYWTALYEIQDKRISHKEFLTWAKRLDGMQKEVNRNEDKD